MAQTLELTNYASGNIVEQTNLATALTNTGNNSISTFNNNGFAANDYFLLGALGGETSELLIVQSVSGAATIVATTSNQQLHAVNEPVTKLFGNKLRVYRASNVNGNAPDDTAFSLLSTVDIDSDQAVTSYTDSIGSSSYWYKMTYYNSQSTSETALASATAYRGGNYGNYCSISSIRNEAGFKNNRNISDTDIDAFRQQAQAEVNGSISGIVTIPMVEPINPWVSRITIMLAAGFLQVDQYGSTFNIDSTGQKNAKIKWAEDELLKIKNGQTVITDTAGNDVTLLTESNAGGYPNNETTSDEDDTEGFMFERVDISGYYGRKY